MARPSYPVYVTTAPASSDRRRQDGNGGETRGRGRTSGRERGLVVVGHPQVHDRLERPLAPRPVVHKHCTESRSGRVDRRHQHEYHHHHSPHSREEAGPEARSTSTSTEVVAKEVAHTATRRRGRGGGEGGERPGRQGSHLDKGGDWEGGRSTHVGAGHLGKQKHGETLRRVATVALGAAALEAAAATVRHGRLDARKAGSGLLGASIGGLVVDSFVQKLR